MTKLPIAKAAELVGASKSTIYRNVEEGKISATTNNRGLKAIDIAELERYYGPLKTDAMQPNGKPEQEGLQQDGKPEQEGLQQDGNVGKPEQEGLELSESENVVAIQQQYIDFLKTQIENEKSEKRQLIGMLEKEQEKTRCLMLPPPAKKQRSWRSYFRLRK